MKTKHLFISLLALFVSFTAKAQENPDATKIGDIYYILSPSDYTAAVTWGRKDDDGEDVWYNEDCYIGEVTIPSTVTYNDITYSVTTIDDGAFVESQLTSITIPNSVTTIGRCPFYNCTALTSLTIPSSVTRIKGGAFEGCDNLTSITVESRTPISLPDGDPFPTISYLVDRITLHVPAGTKQAYKAAQYWTRVNNIVEDVGSTIVFADELVKTICVSNWDVSGDGELGEKEAALVTDIGTVFRNNNTISSFNEFQYFTGVTSLNENSYYGCTALTSITIPKNVTTISSNPFRFCDALVNIVVTNDNTTFDSRNSSNAIIETATNTLITGCKNTVIPNTVSSIGLVAFQDARFLSSINIPNSVTSIGSGAFKNCTRLTEIQIPESVTSIGGGAFYNCSSLDKAYFASMESLCSIDFQWSGISGETYSSNPSFYAEDLYIDGVLLTGDVIIPEGVESIGTAAFYKCRKITSVHIPSSVRSIGQYAFYLCTNLSSINLPEISRIERYSFYGCPFTSISIPSSVTWIRDYAFCSCRSLNNIVWPENLEYIDNAAFNLCENLSSVVLPKKVKSLGESAFDGCSSLESISIPNTVTYIGSAAFYGCSNLTSMYVYWENPITITYPDVFSYRTNATLYVPYDHKSAYEAAYYWKDFKEIVEAPAPAQNIDFADANVKALCVDNWDTNDDGEFDTQEAAAVTDLGEVFKGNTDITLFDELQYFTGLESIGENAFKECSNLTSATLPDGLLTIESGAFQKSGLTSIQFPTTLTSVGSCAFAECASLADIDFTGCQAAFYEGCFQWCSALEELYVPNTVKFRGYNTFWGCSSLQTAIFEAFEEGQEKWSVEHLFSADYTTSSLETVVLPATSVITKGGLKNCSNLQTVTFLEDDAPVNNSRHFIKNFTGVPDDVLFVIPEGTAENFLKRGYKNLSDKSGLPLVRAEFEAEAARIVTMANALTDGNKTALTSAITEARTTVNATDDYMTVYVQIAAIKNAAKTYLGTTTLPESFDVTAAYITNPDFDRFDIGWSMSNYAADCGYYTGDNYQYTNGEVSIDHFVESWSGEALEDGSISQTITNLPIGRYRLECDAIATWKADASVEVTGVNLFAGVNKVPLATENEKPQHFTVDFTQYRTGDITIGIDINNTTANWVAMDNVRLYSRVSDITSPVDENTAYYLQNVETGKYLNQGNEWGTHAVLADEGLPVKVVKRAAGSYTVEFLEGSDHDHLLFRFDYSDDKVYVDYNSEDESQNPYWIISDAETEGTYYIQSILNAETMYLGNNPTKEALFYGYALGRYNDVDANILNQEGMNITWRFVKVDNEEDYLTVDDTEGFVGGKVTLNVGMTNTESIKGVQFDLRLPAGVMVATDANDEMMISLTDRAHSSHQVSPRLLSNGDYRIVITSMSAKTFSGTEGDIMNITLNVAGNVDEGDYEVKVSSVELNTKQNVRIQPTDVTATLTLNIRDVILGDANGDGDVTVTDVGMVIDDILENTPANFVKAAADVNEDGDVTVTDVGLIIDIILSDGAATRRFDEEDESEVLDPQ